MIESSTYVYDVYRFFSEMGIEAHVAHAKTLRMITSSDKKMDKNDAEALGRYLRLWKRGEIELSMSYVPTKEECELRDTCRLKEEVSRKSVTSPEESNFICLGIWSHFRTGAEICQSGGQL